MSELIEGDYRGNAMLIIRQSSQDKFPFQFGVTSTAISDSDRMAAQMQHENIELVSTGQPTAPSCLEYCDE